MMIGLEGSFYAKQPKIGLFWFNYNDSEYRIFHSEKIDVKDGYACGGFIFYPKSHHDIWKLNFDESKHGKFYETPRGRVAFRTVDNMFVVYNGFKEPCQEFKSMIINEFNLPSCVDWLYGSDYDVDMCVRANVQNGIII